MDEEERWRKFDRPVLSTEPQKEEVEYAGGTALDTIIWQIKPHIPKIIALVAIIAIAFIAYSLLVGSSAVVTIIVKDTEGGNVDSSSVRIFDESGKQLLFEESGKSLYEFTLNAGNYKVSAVAPGYRAKGEFLEVSSDGAEKRIVLEKAIDVRILDVDFPNALYVDSNDSAVIFLQNSSSEMQTVELVFEKDLNKLQISMPVQQIMVPAGGVEGVSVDIKVPETIQVNDSESGDEKNAKIRIRYTLEAWESTYKIFPKS